MDRSVEARLQSAKLRKRVLLETETSLREKLQRTRDAIAECDSDIKACETAGRATGRGVAEETWRRTVRQLGTFTVSELATELGVTVPTARRHLETMMTMASPMAKPAGRVLGQNLYEYVRPTSAGDAFDQQQRHGRLHLVDDIVTNIAPGRGQAVAGTGGRPEDAIAAKEVREAVRDAIVDGWTLHKKGDGHWVLLKDGRRVGVAGTPRNPGGAADIIRRQTRRAS